MPREDKVNVGLTQETLDALEAMKNDGVFGEMRDGYRLGIALAIARRGIASEDIATKNYLHVGSLDPEGIIANVITELYPESRGRPYAFSERLAEWGVAQIATLYQNGSLSFTDLFNETEAYLRVSEVS